MSVHVPELSVLLVERIARRMRLRLPRHLDPDDLLSDGLMGLLDAQRSFDWGRGVPFAAFAIKRIRGAMLDGVRRRYRAARAELPLRHPNLICADDPCTRQLECCEARDRLQALTRRQRLGLVLHYIEGLSLRETGSVLGTSEAGAGMLLGRALRKLRESKKQPRGRRGPRGRHFSPHTTPDHR